MFTTIRISLIAALLASTLPTAADAHRRHHRHKHDGFDVGDAIIGAAVLGAVVSILGSGKKDRDERRGEPVSPAPYPDDRYPGDDDDDRNDREDRDAGWNDGRGEWSRVDPDYNNRFPSERAAVDACAREAESLGSRYGANARVSYIGEVASEGREYRVTGRMETDIASDARAPFDRFTCFADGSRVTGFRYG